MKNFNRKFKEKFREYYAFRYLCYSLLFMIVGIIFMSLSNLYIIFGYLAIILAILWIIFIAIPNNRIVEIRFRLSKELELEKLVNEAYIKEFIKEKK